MVSQNSASIQSVQAFTALPLPKGMCSPFLPLFLQTCFVFPTSAISISHSCLYFLFFLHSLYFFPPHTDIRTSILKYPSCCSFPPPPSFYYFIYSSWFLTVLPSTLWPIYCSLTASFFHSLYRYSCSLFPLTPKFHICCWCTLLRSSSCQYARRGKVFPKDRDEMLLSRSKMLSGSTT